MRKAISVVMLLCLAPAAVAADQETGAVPQEPEFGVITCRPSAEIIDLVFDDVGIRLNNISLREDTHFATGGPALFLEASVVNKTPRTAVASVEVVGLAQSKMLFALSAGPALGLIAGQKSEQLSGWVVQAPATLSHADQICVRANFAIRAQ